jgi:hypothetical protein
MIFLEASILMPLSVSGNWDPQEVEEGGWYCKDSDGFYSESWWPHNPEPRCSAVYRDVLFPFAGCVHHTYTALMSKCELIQPEGSLVTNSQYQMTAP